MNKKLLIGLTIFLIIIIGVAVYLRLFRVKEVHYHAGFQVYIDGKQKDFSAMQYMSLIPCGKNTGHEDEQLEKAHLHDTIGDVVHVHRDNAVWGDLFKNINYQINTTQPVEAYLNGKKVNNIFAQKINPYDSLILLIGKNMDIETYLTKQVTKSKIMSVEKKSESCGI